MKEIFKACVKILFSPEIYKNTFKADKTLTITKAYMELGANKNNFEQKYREKAKTTHPDACGDTKLFQYATECYKYIKEYLKEL